MKTIRFIDKKWQSSVTTFVEVTYTDGSQRYYVQGRYGGLSLTSDDYAKAKPCQPSAWKRYLQLDGERGIVETVIDANDLVTHQF